MNSNMVRNILLPPDHPLKTKRVAPGMYVVIENTYIDRDDYFDSVRVRNLANSEAARDEAKDEVPNSVESRDGDRDGI